MNIQDLPNLPNQSDLPNQEVEQRIDNVVAVAHQRINQMQSEIRQVQEEIVAVERENAQLQDQVQHNNAVFIDVTRYQNPFAVPEVAVPALNAHPDLYESALRRRVRAELTELNDLLGHTNLNDEMTNNIRIWAAHFWNALLLNCNDDEIFQEFSQLMQEMLKDPIYQAPLDEETMLGSDGFSYGKKSHIVWQSQVTEIYKKRSPMDPENPASFELVSHPIARHMVQWLKKNNLLLVSPKIEETYQRVMKKEREDRIQRLRDKRAQREQEKQRVVKKKEQEMNAIIDKVVEPINEVRKINRENAAKIIGKLDEIERDNKKNTQEKKDEIKKSNDEIKKVEKRNDKLEKKIITINKVIKEVENENDKLKQAIEETRKAIKKQRNGWVKGVLKTAAVVAACALTTWGIVEIAGEGFAIVPLGGGAKGVISFTF